MSNFKNAIIKYDRVEADIYSVTDYTSKNFNALDDYIVSLDDDVFELYQMADNDVLERISLELYGTADYWDTILLINKRIPLIEFALDIDTLIALSDVKVQRYIDVFYKDNLSALVTTEMTTLINAEYDENNELFRVLKVVKPSRMAEFLQGGYEQGIF